MIAVEGVKIVIPSRHREKPALVSSRLFGDCDVCVSEQEADSYAAAGIKHVTTHPNNLYGIGQIRQWILDNYQDEIILMSDDDVTYAWSNTGYYGKRIDDPREVLRIVANTANCAADIGAHVFGFSQVWDTRKYSPLQPISLCTWIGAVIGFVGRSEAKFSRVNRLRVDIDYCLQSLMHERVVYQDSRFAFVQNRFGMTGGNSVNRSAERDAREVGYLLSKWGKYISARYTAAGSLLLKVHVRRKQNKIKVL